MMSNFVFKCEIRHSALKDLKVGGENQAPLYEVEPVARKQDGHIKSVIINRVELKLVMWAVFR